jgi:hypothetical protein
MDWLTVATLAIAAFCWGYVRGYRACYNYMSKPSSDRV